MRFASVYKDFQTIADFERELLGNLSREGSDSPMKKKEPRPVLKALRRVLGLTQVDLGGACGVSGSLLAQIERGEVPGSPAVRARICELVAEDLGLEALIFGDRLSDRREHAA